MHNTMKHLRELTLEQISEGLTGLQEMHPQQYRNLMLVVFPDGSGRLSTGFAGSYDGKYLQDTKLSDWVRAPKPVFHPLSSSREHKSLKLFVMH